MTNLRKPDFLCIGPEKTATGWLYKILGEHPEVWIPPIKELRFLNEGNVIPDHNLKNLAFNSHWHYVSLRIGLLREMVKLILRNRADFNRFRRLLWILNYYFGARSFDWYTNLFRYAGTKSCGDFSPLYYDIPESKIAELSRHNKNVKILIFVRNPIERVWSKALMNLCRHKGRDFVEVSRSEFITFFDEVHKNWNPYLKTIDLWKTYFPDTFVGFYDTLNENPSNFFRDICDFLGIDKNIVIASIGDRVNKGIGIELPGEFALYLRSQYYDEIKQMADCGYSHYPKLWLESEYSLATERTDEREK